MAQANNFTSSIPFYFREEPLLKDRITTPTLEAQYETVAECLPLIAAVDDASRSPFDFDENGIPTLTREDHAGFLYENLEEFPAPFVGIDASRPWMVYWGLLGLYLLGQDVSSFRKRVVTTFYSMQNPSGGFGGGYGQYSHLAATYAALLCLALVGGEESYSLIDRPQMWRWLGRLKQLDGGFQVCEGGEEDVRGAYTAMVAVSLLGLPLELPPDSPARKAGLRYFTDGLGEYLSRCQTYEGGMAAAPGNEAHGAYTFCAVACLCLLGAPEETMTSYLDLDTLLNWLSARQYAPEGGFAGRTNKLVDGCYNHWIGNCWPLLQAALNKSLSEGYDLKSTIGNLFSAEGLARYILGCAQAPSGGLRDKPSKRPDSYHTCYNLAGLSMLEYVHSYSRTVGSSPFDSAFSWASRRNNMNTANHTDGAFEVGDEVEAIHPVYVIPHAAVTAMRQWSEQVPLDTTKS